MAEETPATHPVLLAKERQIAKRVELLLGLTHKRVEAGLHVGQLLPDVVHQDLEETRRKKLTVSFRLAHMVRSYSGTKRAGTRYHMPYVRG